MKGIIYRATNTYNGMVYIGQTVAGLPKRRAQHYRDAKSDSENAFHLALYQYPNGFVWDVLDEFSGDRGHIIHALNVAEEYQILKHRSNDEKFGYNATAGGYSSDKFAEHIQRRQKSLGGTAKQILQYSADGEFIREFSSLNEVAAHLNKTKMHLKTLTDGGLHYGFQWRVKHNELHPEKVAPYTPRTRKCVKVVVYDGNGNLYGVFDTAKEAGMRTGTSPNVRDEIRDISVRENNARPFYFFRHAENYPQKIKVEITRRKERSVRGDTPKKRGFAVYSADGDLVECGEFYYAEIVRKYRVGENTVRKDCESDLPLVLPANRRRNIAFRYSDGNAPERIEIIKQPKQEYKPKMEHRIIQYTLHGDFVKVWDNTHQAAESGADTENLIRKCLSGKRRSPKLNYQWTFYTPDFQQTIGAAEIDTPKKAGRKKKNTGQANQPLPTSRMEDTIEEVSYDGTVLATYRDTAEAAQKSGFSQSYVCNVLAGKIRHPRRRFRRIQNR